MSQREFMKEIAVRSQLGTIHNHETWFLWGRSRCGRVCVEGRGGGGGWGFSLGGSVEPPKLKEKNSQFLTRAVSEEKI